MGWLDSEVRGDIPEEIHTTQILTVGLFDGLGALPLAVDALGIPVAGHLSVEKESTAKRVVESYFPDAVFHDDVQTVDAALVRSLSLRYPSVGLVLIGAGPPCQGVSGLNASKKGALLDARSSLFLASGVCLRNTFPGRKRTCSWNPWFGSHDSHRRIGARFH